VSRGNGASPPDPLENLDDAIEELRGSEWEDEEITAKHLMDAVQMGAVIATGKHKAMSKDQADEITLTDHGSPPKPESEPPPSKLSPLVVVWVVARKFPPWGAVIVALAGIAAYVMLRK
jgi:hypothetical protein